jgi:hypothetical protein
VQYSQIEIAKWDSTVDASRQWQKILHESKTPFVDYAQWWHKFKKTNDVEVYGPYGCLFSYNDSKLPELEGEWRAFGSNIADLCRLKDEAANHMHYRVNNLANLEALLNIVANVLESLGILCGGYRLLDGFMYLVLSWRSAHYSARSRIIKLASKKGFVGISIILAGLAMPGVINWLVASARDANLFS